MDSKFNYISKILPLSFQHVLAMFVGTIVPPLLIAKVAGISGGSVIPLIQSALFVSAIATLIQLIPIKIGPFSTGSNLPLVMGMSYVFLGVGLSVVGRYGLSALFGGLLISSLAGIIMGCFIHRIKRIFTPLISGILVLCMGIGLYDPAIDNLAGGIGSPIYKEPINFIIGLSVTFIIILLTKFGKKHFKDSAILIGIIFGYIVCFIFGIIDFSPVSSAKWFALPRLLSYGMTFKLEVILTFIVVYAIGIIDFMGCCTVTSLGGFDRNLEEKEFSGGVIGAAIGSIFASLFGALPTAGLSQNAAIISLNKKTNKTIFYLVAIIILITSLSPKFAVLLTTIPSCVIGGATLVVFGMISMAGISLLTMFDFSESSKLIAGISIAASIGISRSPDLLANFPEIIQSLVGGSSILTGVILGIFLQEIFAFIESKKIIKENKIITKKININ